MGKRRSIAFVFLFMGIVILLFWFIPRGYFEEVYKNRVEENYHSINDARDILSKAFWSYPEAGRPPLPPEAKEVFKKLPSVLEVAQGFPIYLGAAGRKVVNSGEYEYYEVEIWTYGVTPEIMEIANIDLLEGRFLTWEDVEKERMVCVLEDHPNNLLIFGRKMGIGNYLTFDSPLDERGQPKENPKYSFEIVGLVKTHTVFNYQNQGLKYKVGAYVPLSSAVKVVREESVGLGYNPDYYYYCRVLDTEKGVLELEEAVKKLMGMRRNPYSPFTQRIEGDVVRYPSFDEEYKYYPLIPFTNHALISLRTRWMMFNNLPFLSLFFILTGNLLLWRRKKVKENQ